jgi:ribonuclease E
MSNSDSLAGSTGGPVTVPALDDLPEKMRVHALARLLGRTSREVLAVLADIGVEVRSAQSSIDRKAAEQVVTALAPGAGVAGPAVTPPTSAGPEIADVAPLDPEPVGTAPVDTAFDDPAPVDSAPDDGGGSALAPIFAPPAPLFQPPTRPARTRRRSA